MHRVLCVALLVPLALVPAKSTFASRPAASNHGQFVSHHGNLSMEVSDPPATVERVERAVRKLGGIVQNASSNSDNGNVSGSIPASQLDALIKIVRAFPGRTTSSSTSTSDLSSSVRTAKQRMRDLELAEEAIGKAMTRAASSDEKHGLIVLGELVNRERQNAANQIDSLMSQSNRAQLHMNFSRPR